MFRKKDFLKAKRTLSLFLVLLMLTSIFTGISVQGADVLKADANASMSVSAVQPSSGSPSTFSWDNATVYFMLMDRFFNGDTSNDHAYGRALDANGNPISGWQDAHGTFHGGDFKGVTQKINEGYFNDLGVNAIWITAPYEQIHGYVDAGGSRGNLAYYSYHGYWVLDYTETDKNMGTKEEFKELVDTAHEHGIRIVMDVVMNHSGYYTIADMEEYGFGTLKSGYESWRQSVGNASGYQSYIDLTSSNWSKWWGKDWVRDNTVSGYDRGGSDDQTSVLYDLPDFKVESTTTVGIPELLKTKWQKEGTYDAKAAKYGTSGTVSDYLVKWLAEWVETYGVDGFRCDTAKHIPVSAWGKLKTACTEALKTWKANNPTKKLDDLDFWMTGENWGQNLSNGYNDYYKTGKFDSMINFAFGSAGGNNMPGASSINSTYSGYASSLNSNDKYNLLTYISSHDDGLSRGNSIWTGSALLLMPGGVQIFYGDETDRPLLNVGGDFAYRSDMNWDVVDSSATLKHWQKVGQFRNNHIAVGAGNHTNLSATSGTAFARTYNKNGINDEVAVVIGATANTNVTVTLNDTFSNGTVVKNAYDGSTATVSNGKVTFNSGANGTILIESLISIGISGDAVFENSQTVTLNLRGVDSATVTIDDGTPFTAVNGQQFTIGENTELGGTVTITVTAAGSDGDVTKTFTFKKKDPNEKIKIYFDNTSNWSNVNAYIYDESVDPVIKNGEWPGVAMTKDSTTGYYVIEVSENLVNGQVIFNGGGTQYPGSQQPGLVIGNQSKLFKFSDKSWTDYQGPTEPTQPTQSDDYITVRYHASKWTNVNCYWWTSTIDSVAWPGRAMTNTGTTDKSGKTIFTINVPNDAGNPIFNNGTTQCFDYTWADKNIVDFYMDEGTNKSPLLEYKDPVIEDYVTIKFYAATWENANCYYVGSDSVVTFPGPEMENTGETDSAGRKIYSIEVPKSAEKLTFSTVTANGSRLKTLEYEWTDKSIVEFYTDNETQDGKGNVLPYEGSIISDETVTTFYIAKNMVPNGVNAVKNAYFFSDAGVALMGKWPGTDITVGYESEEEGYYKVEIRSNSSTIGVVVSNSNGMQYPKNGEDMTVPAGTIAHLNSDGTLTYKQRPGEFTKENAYSSGLWIDTQEEITDSPIALVKMDSSNTLYVPAGVDLSNVTVYHKYGSNFTLNGSRVASGQKANLAVSSRGTKQSFSSSEGTIYVMQSESPALYLTTGNDVLTFNYTESKDSYKDSGTYLSVNKDGTIDNQGVLAQIKGRGNSSWEASYKIFGKYAYNIKLESKANLFGMDSSKKWCLLANNADEAMMRNMVVYNMANEIGLDFSPMFKSVDLYDNGQYVGTYLVTEKVDVGKNNLVKINSLDDANEEANGNQKIEDIARQNISGNLKYYVGNSGTLNNPEDITGGYLLEFELDERYGDEPSGFVSTKGQQVVVKSPEFATKEEVEYISALFNAAESAVYSSDGYATYNGKRVHYSDLIDVDSFAKMYLIQEFTENLDACATSFYIYKESDLLGDGKLHAAPVWDYDWTLGQYQNEKNINGSTLRPNNTSQWWARYKNIYRKSGGHNGTKNFLAKLCENGDFWELVKHQWNSLVKDKVSVEINNVDTYYNDIKSSVSMNENKWEIIKNNKGKGQHTSETILQWGSVDTGSTHSAAVSYLKDWMNRRLLWLNSQSDLSGDPLSGCTETGINGTQNLTLLNGVFTYTATVEKGNYSVNVLLNGTNVSSQYDASLNNLDASAAISQSGTSFNVNLSSKCEFTIVYNSMTNKLYFTAAKIGPDEMEFAVTYKAENNTDTVKNLIISVSDEESMKAEIALEGPELRSAYYDYLWKAANVSLDVNNNTATVTAEKTPHMYTVKVYKDGEVKFDEKYEYQTIEMNGDANPNGLVELKKADYGFENSTNVKWCTKYVDPVSNTEEEYVLSTNSNYSFYVTRDIDIYISEFTGTVTSDYKTTILGTNYENLSTATGEKVRFKFNATVDTPNGLYNNVNGLGVVLVECDRTGAPLNGLTEANLAENVNKAANGSSVSGIHRYMKTGENVKPNSRGEYIYNISLANNEANKSRYFRAYSLFALQDGTIYVSDNSIIASIAFC